MLSMPAKISAPELRQEISVELERYVSSNDSFVCLLSKRLPKILIYFSLRVCPAVNTFFFTSAKAFVRQNRVSEDSWAVLNTSVINCLGSLFRVINRKLRSLPDNLRAPRILACLRLSL
jgi:hypothetical protein